MTGNTLESAPTGQGGESPNSQAGTGSGQQSSGEAIDLQRRLDELAKVVTGVTKELDTFKSGKDRGINAVTKEVGALKASVGEIERLMKERNVGVGEAINILESKQVEDEFRQNLRDVAQYIRGGGLPSAGNGAGDTAEVVNKYGLSADDPEVKVLQAQKASELAFAQLALRKVKAPTPSDADRPATPASPVASSLTPQEVETKAAELRAMYKKPSQYRTKINELEKELEAYLPK